MEENKINSEDITSLISLDKSTNELADKIIKENNLEELRNLTHLFNINQAKKNALRVLKLNSLLDHVSDEMINRFEKVPGEFSNNDLLSYMNVVQASIDRANKSLNLVDESPAIQFNQLNVNMNAEDDLDRESREKVADAVKAILNKLKLSETSNEEIIIQEDKIEVSEENKNPMNLLNEEE